MVDMIRCALGALNEDWEIEMYRNAGPDTPIYSVDSPLDSLRLVSLIAAIEDKVAEDHGIEVVLADERAMSLHRSPFKNVGTLADYTRRVVADASGLVNGRAD